MHGIPDGWRGGPLNALESKEWRDSGTCQKIRAPFSGWRQKPNAHLFEPRCRVYTRVYTRGPNLTKSGQMSIPSVIQVDTSTCVHGSRGFSPITTDIHVRYTIRRRWDAPLLPRICNPFITLSIYYSKKNLSSLRQWGERTAGYGRLIIETRNEFSNILAKDREKELRETLN